MYLDKQHPHYVPLKKMTKMVYKDLQAACIVRGMDFGDVTEGDWGRLGSWFCKNYEVESDREILEDFDLWVDNQLEKRGIAEDDPFRRFRRFSTIDDEGEPVVKTRSLKKAEAPVKKLEKKQRDKKFGIFMGTKKEYTYKLAESLYNAKGDKYEIRALIKNFAPQLIVKVLKKFPEGKEKSIRIWMKRALDGLQTS